MPDIVSPETRSRMMSGIRGRNTRPEMIVRRFLHAQGFRYRLHASDLPGRPDIVLPRRRAVVFVHGCFWHQHLGCRFAYRPKSHEQFWESKLEANVARDARDQRRLKELGWDVCVVWECEMTQERLGQLVRDLASDPPPVAVS
jgi:DNA mismatch endonuclease (patch repair protein)